jgi:hypothetical protein
MRTSFLPAGLLLAAALPAQHLVVYAPLGGPGFIDEAAPSPLFPGPVPPTAIYPTAPALPPPVAPGPPFFLPPGDSSLNSINGMNWYTNGVMVAASGSVLYPALPPVLPFPIGVIGGILAGPVTGMALNPAAGILWLTDGAIIVGCAPVAGTPVLVPPFPSPAPMVTGLDWDGLSGTLRAVTAAGAVWTITPAGVPVGPPVVPFAALPGMPADIAIDKTGLPGIAGPRNIFILVGPMIMEVNSGLMFPAGPIGPGGVGLAFHPRPSANPPLGVCPCPSFAHGYGTTMPMTAGNLGFGLTVTGLPAGQLVVYAFDFGFNPAFPVINGIGCGLGFFFGSPTLVTGAAFASPAGTATYGLPLGVPPGFGPIYHQSATLCPAAPAGFVLNPTLLLAACGT